MKIVTQLWNLTKRTFVWYPKRSLVAVLLLVGVALMDALSVVSLIPAIEYLSKTTDISRFSQLLNAQLATWGLEQGLVVYFSISALIICAKSLLRYGAKVLLINIQMDFEIKLGESGVAALLEADSRYVEEYERGHLINLLTLEIQKIGECLFYVYDYLAVVLKFVFYFSVLLAFSVPLVLTIALTSVLTMGPSLLLGKAIFRASELRLQKSGQVMDYLSQLASSVFEIKAYSAEKFFASNFFSRLSSFKRTHGRMLLLQDLTGIILEPLGILQIIVIVYLALGYFSLTFSETLIVLFTLRNLLPLFGQLMSYKQVLIAGIPSFNHVDDLLQGLAARSENHHGARLPGFTRALTLKNVSFAYQTRTIIDQLNLTIPRGSSVALVGTSGAGKSTVLKMLLGALRPSVGEVLVDGASIFDHSITSWRSMVGFVPQEPILLKDTLRSNVAVGQTSVDEERLLLALELASLKGFVASLPQGLDTVLGEKGVSLSSGQKQRISFARALYKNPEVIMLDEPTSALDAESEAGIKQTIELLRGKKTLIIIAHRLSTIKSCDQIHVMDHGKIIESGSFDELVRLGGKFNSLVSSQGL